MQDENTFYVGSGSNTSGGSSGSPVINSEGNAVALNAGGALLSASAYYLPLNRVQRALNILLQDHGGAENAEIPRGTIEAAFKFSYFDAVRRLGVPVETETKVIAHQEKIDSPITTGMLTVESVIPEGAAFGKLVPGDVLVSIDGKIVADFFALEAILDDNVGKRLEFELYRGRQLIHLKIQVRNLNDYTPDRFVEVGGGVFHSVPYSYCKVMNVPSNKGVWSAARGFVLGNKINSYAVLYKVNEEEILTLSDFVRSVKKLQHHERFSVTWHKQVQGETRTQKTAGILMERQFIAGDVVTWVREPKKHVKEPDQWRKLTKKEEEIEYNMLILKEGESSNIDTSKEKIDIPEGLSDLKNFWTGGANMQRFPDWAKKVLPLLVLIEYRTPVGPEILEHNNRSVSVGTGMVIAQDDKEVIIACDRETVPQQMGLVQVEFAKICKVFGTIKFVHPFHNLALLSVARKRLGDYPLPASLPLARERLAPGENCNFVGLTDKGECVVQDTTLLSYFTPNYKLISPPAWRERNVIGYHLMDDLAGIIGGILVNDDAELIGLYCHFMCQSDDYDRCKEWEYAILPVRDYIAPLLKMDNILLGTTSSDQHSDFSDESPGSGNEQEAKDEKTGAEVEENKEKSPKRRKVMSSDHSGTGESSKKQEKKQSTFSLLTHIPSLSCEFRAISLSEAPHHGLSASWITKLVANSEANTQALLIERVTSGGCAEVHDLREGDLLVQVNEAVVVTPLDVEHELFNWQKRMENREKYLLVRDHDDEQRDPTKGPNGNAYHGATSTPTTTSHHTAQHQQHKCRIILVRSGEVITKDVVPDLLGCDTADQLCMWNGLLMIPTPKAVRERGIKPIVATGTTGVSREDDDEAMKKENKQEKSTQEQLKVVEQQLLQVASTTTPKRTSTMNEIFVARLLQGSPATAQEMEAGCFLEKIDEHSVADMSFDEFVEFLKAHYSTKEGTDEEASGEEEIAIAMEGVVGGGDHASGAKKSSKSTSAVNNNMKPTVQVHVQHQEPQRQGVVAKGAVEMHGGGTAGNGGAALSCTTSTSYNARFTRIMVRDLEGRESAKTLLRNDKFFPAMRIRKVKDSEDNSYERERL
ncbi:unnamed protein product [Amoebophrya sp. A25]|nr:unnamed protein product [Amoebophrya sp. A25]|eukprot:GSA25T00019811001.1